MDRSEFDAEYLERLKSGDKETEQHFFEYFQEILKSRLASLKHSPSLADDVRQETLLRAWSAIRSEAGIGDPERFGAFVSDICHNILTEAYRTKLAAEGSQEKQRSEQTSSSSDEGSSDFTVTFDPELSAEQIKGTLVALAEYYRQCGGVGLEVDFELEEVLASEFTYV